MIFLLPIVLIIAVIFGVDHFYFNKEDAKIIKKEENLSKNKANLMKVLINKRLKDD